MQPHSDDDITRTASVDQATAGTEDVARLIAAFWFALRKRGISRIESTYLAAAYVAGILRRGPG